MTARRRSVIALVVCVIGLSAVLPANASAPARRLPPSDRDELARIFDPKVEDLGFRTTRAALQNLDTYAVDPDGRHLAIYLEPTADEFSDAEYVAAFMETTRVFLPSVFKRWKGLESFDVCLEPLPSEDASTAPAPITQILVSRDGYREIKWRTATLADVLAVGREYSEPGADQEEFYVYFASRLDTVPELIGARTEAAAQG